MLPNELVQVRHMIDYSSNGQYKIFVRLSSLPVPLAQSNYQAKNFAAFR